MISSQLAYNTTPFSITGLMGLNLIRAQALFSQLFMLYTQPQSVISHFLEG